MENTKDRGCSNIQEIIGLRADAKQWVCSIYPSDEAIQFTAEKAEKFSIYTMQRLMLYVFYCEIFCMYLRKHFFLGFINLPLTFNIENMSMQVR